MRTNQLLQVASSLGIAVASLSLAPAAWAQTTPAAEAKDQKAGDEIIVTAERKAQNLQKYGGTSTVVTGKLLAETGVQNITDLQGRIPGLDILPNNNNLEVYIRGVGSSNNTELGDPAAGTHYDGIYIPRPSGFGSIFFDIDRVEVNVGPQGTLRGRNATAGTVNIIPWHPGLNIWDGYVEAGIGNYGQKSVEGGLNAPLTNTLAIRVSGEHLEHDSYTHNVGPVTGLKGPEWEDNYAGRVQLLWKPNDTFDMLLSYDNTVENGGGVIGTNLAGAEGNNVAISSLNLRDVYLFPTDPHQHTAHSGEKAEFNYHGKDFDAQLTVSHRHLFTDWLGAPPGLAAYPGGLAAADANDATGSIANDYSHYETQNMSNSDTQELRITAPKGSRLEWTLGGFHFSESQASFLGSVADQNAYFQGNEFNTRTRSSSLAAYTDETFHVDSKLSLSGGLRYTDETKDRTGVAARYMMLLGGAGYGCCMGPVIGTPGFQFMGLSRTDFNIPNPIYAVAPQGSPQLSISQQEALTYYLDGIKSFGVNDTVPGIFPGGMASNGASGNCVNNPSAGLYCAAGNNYTYAPGLDGTQFYDQNASDHYHFLDWRARAQVEIDADHMAYALVATGNKAGGFNDNLGSGGPAITYNPERLTNFEIGSKNRFTIAGEPVKFNISAFYELYHNQQLTSLLSLCNEASYNNIVAPNASCAIVVDYTYNAANSVIAGSQFDGSITIPEAKLNIAFDGLWLPEAKVTSSQSIEDFRFQSDIDSNDAGLRSIQGKRLPRTSKYQFNMRISQKFETGLGEFDYVLAPGYRSSTYATIFNGEDYAYQACQTGGTVTSSSGAAVGGCGITTTYRGRLNDTIPGYWTFDIGGGFSTSTGRVRIEAYANNLIKRSLAGLLISQSGGTVAFMPRPTTYGARVRVRF